MMAEPVTPERDALVAGLNWQGWFGTGPHGFTRTPADVPLLWHGKFPLVMVRVGNAAEAGAETAGGGDGSRGGVTPPTGKAGGRKLVLAFDWATSNAGRLPATVLLARRFLEAERDGQRAAYAANFDCGAPVALRGVAGTGLTMSFEPAETSVAVASAKENASGAGTTRVIAAAEWSDLRAPGQPGFFMVSQGGEALVRGAAQFADPRAGDFRRAERFVQAVGDEREAAIERNTAGDPLEMLWLGLIAAAVLGSWWTRGSAKDQGPSSRETAMVKPVGMEVGAR